MLPRIQGGSWCCQRGKADSARGSRGFCVCKGIQLGGWCCKVFTRSSWHWLRDIRYAMDGWPCMDIGQEMRSASCFAPCSAACSVQSRLLIVSLTVSLTVVHGTEKRGGSHGGIDLVANMARQSWWRRPQAPLNPWPL